MKREIEFRGQKADNKEWVYGYLVCIPDGDSFDCYIISDFDERDSIYDLWKYAIKVIPETVGQYTGIKDKNGKKIFEFDVVKVRITQTEDKQTYVDCKYKIGVIVYNEDFALFTCKNNFMNFINWAFNDYEVIGNVYDNPELLNDKESDNDG